MHRAIDAVDVVDLQDRPPLGTGLGAGLEQPVDRGGRRPGIVAVDDQPVLVQVFGPGRHAVLLQIFRRGKGIGSHGQQVALD